MDTSGRILKELKEFEEAAKKSKEQTVVAKMLGSDMRHWKGTIFGPKDTPYEGGIFVVDIQIPAEYPFKPPKMKFDTKIWHPNISSQTGAICLDILKNEWTPALTIRTALISLQALMCAPEPDDPQDAEVAKQYKSNRELFNQTSKYWTANFAKEPASKEAEKVKKITEMGFSEDQAKEALMKYDWDENYALNYLLGGA